MRILNETEMHVAAGGVTPMTEPLINPEVTVPENRQEWIRMHWELEEITDIS